MQVFIILSTLIAIVASEGYDLDDLNNKNIFSYTECSDKCKDTHVMCGIASMKNHCQHFFLSALLQEKCPRMCKRCIPCAGQMECSDDCKDDSNLCFSVAQYCTSDQYGPAVRQRCKQTCGACRACDDDKKLAKCDPFCHDTDATKCKYWAGKMNYCSGSVYSKWMQDQCPLSCGQCRKCPLRPTIFTKPKTTRDPYVATTKPSRTTKYVPQTTDGTSQGLCSRGKKIGVSLSAQCLNAHNYYRCLHGVAPLKYDYQLQRTAQNYANKLPTATELKGSKQGTADRLFGVGENIAWSFEDSRFDVNDAVTQWYAHGLSYDYDIHSSKAEDTDQFTQMIWQDTKTVGCALKKYKDETYIVAHYRTEGNLPGEFEFNINKPGKATCDESCTGGRCRSNTPFQSSDCLCTNEDQPLCYGTCVVKCDRPEDYYGDWIESCEGADSCSCSTEQDWAHGVPRGAVCR